jgi:tyrosine phenol-lyase
VRMEATTNLIGGQPFSMENLRQVKELIAPMGIFLVVDGSLISENAYFIRQREPGYENVSIRDIIREIMSIADLCYMSGRKSCSVRGGMIATNRKICTKRFGRGCRCTKDSSLTAGCPRRRSRRWRLAFAR